VAVLVGRVLEPDRDLPAHVRLPVERPLAGLEGADVQGAAGAAGEAGPVEEDARILDEAGHGRLHAVVAGFAGSQEAAPLGLGVELHLIGAQPHERLDDVGDVVVVDEVGAVGAAALLHLGCWGVEDARAAHPVDAAVVGPQERGVEDPRPQLGRVLEGDPLVQVVGGRRHRPGTLLPRGPVRGPQVGSHQL
jgi:hypothetical protein